MKRLEPRAEAPAKAPELRLVLWGSALNLTWEALQTPLYADRGRSVCYLVWSRLHCTLGDVLILLGCFWLVALMWRDRRWIAAGRLAPRLLFVTLGVAYTVASEVLNTRLFHSWAYAPEMPHISGVGLAPILQWFLIPGALLFILTPRTDVPTGDCAGIKGER